MLQVIPVNPFSIISNVNPLADPLDYANNHLLYAVVVDRNPIPTLAG